MGRGSGTLNLLGFLIALRWNTTIIDKSLHILKVWKLEVQIRIKCKNNSNDNTSLLCHVISYSGVTSHDEMTHQLTQLLWESQFYCASELKQM